MPLGILQRPPIAIVRPILGTGARLWRLKTGQLFTESHLYLIGLVVGQVIFLVQIIDFQRGRGKSRIGLLRLELYNAAATGSTLG